MVVAALAALALARSHATFPIPREKGGAPPPSDATMLKLPEPIGGLERLYREEFKGDKEVSFLRGRDDKGEVLTIINSSAHNHWTKAVLHGDDLGTTIQVTAVLAIEETSVRGTPPAVVSVLVPRSSVVDQQLRQIDADHAPSH